MYFCIKIFIVTLILLLPVGIALAMNTHDDGVVDSNFLAPAGKTKEIPFEPIEITAKRTALSKTFDNGDGTYKAVIHLAPIHYRAEDGTWLEIDESLPQRGTRSRESGTFSASKDSMITSYDDETRPPYTRSNMGGDEDIVLSLDNPPTTHLWKVFRTLIKFDISSIGDNSIIHSADIKLQYHLSYNDIDPLGGAIEGGQTDPLSIVANLLTKDWTEGTGTMASPTTNGVTWLSTGTTTWSTPGGDYPSTPTGSGQTPSSGYGTTTIDIQSIVQSWVTGTDNNGVVLRANSGQDTLKMFRSKNFGTSADRPKLEVSYTSNRAPEIVSGQINFEMNEDAPPQYINLDRKSYTDGIFNDQDVNDILSFYVWTGTRWGGHVDGGTFETANLTAVIRDNGTLEVTPKPNKHGTDEIRLNATDDASTPASVEHKITIKIISINDPPQINDTTKWNYKEPQPTVTKDSITCSEDFWLNFTVTAWDPIEPGDTSSIRYNSNSSDEYAEFFEIDEITGKVSILPENEHVGIYYLKLIVTDDGTVNNKAEYPFTLEVENNNDKPLITEIVTPQYSDRVYPTTTSITISENAIEDKYFNFTVYADDEDLDLPDTYEQLLVSVKPKDRFTVKTAQDFPKKIVYVSFSPSNDDVGTFIAQLSVTDKRNADTTIELKINVVNVNDPPVFTNFYFGTQIKDLDSEPFQVLDLAMEGSMYEATEMVPYTFSVKGMDFDPGDEIEFEVKAQNRTKTESNDMLTIEDDTDVLNPDEVSGTKKITVLPDFRAGREGEVWLNITATDKLDAEGLLMMRIPVENINDPPPEPTIKVEIVDADRKTRFVKENLTVLFEAKNVSDPDGDDITYSWDFDDSDGIQEDANGMFITWTFPKEGTYTITLTLDDGQGETNITSQELQVFKPAEKETSEDGAAAALGSLGGIPVLYILILVVVIIVILVAVGYMMMQKKKKREEEEAAARAQAEQAQMMAQYGYPMAMGQGAGYYQDPAAMAQYQAYQQQMMMQQQQQQQQPQAQAYGYDQMALMQQLESQPYVQPEAQTMPIQTATFTEGQQAAGLPTPGYPEQPQLPPMGATEPPVGEVVPAPVQQPQPEIPESPFAAVQTQTLEEEIGADAEVAEIPIEPDTSAPEPEVTPEPETPAEPPETKPEGAEPVEEKAAEPTKEGETKAEGEEGAGNKCKKCGAAVKEGWFLCPECKEPLI
jgi:hypothetical protein